MAKAFERIAITVAEAMASAILVVVMIPKVSKWRRMLRKSSKRGEMTS